jgi:signal transduction histidine kinase
MDAVVELPIRRHSFHDALFALATSDDLDSAMACLVDWLGATRVEWWTTPVDGTAPELVAAAGSPRARRHNVRLGSAGVLVVHGGDVDATDASELASLTPLLRRRAAEERLTTTAMRLARRNEALEDFAALVAHELKAPLQAALVAGDPFGGIAQTLELVDTLLDAAQSEATDRADSSVAECLGDAVKDLRAPVAITADVATTLPLPPGPLRVILRNLLSNAIAAGAQNIHVAAERLDSSVRLVVDDDGVGLADRQRYATGSRLGLSLCHRMASRFGGTLQLTSKLPGGARATLELSEGQA